MCICDLSVFCLVHIVNKDCLQKSIKCRKKQKFNIFKTNEAKVKLAQQCLTKLVLRENKEKS